MKNQNTNEIEVIETQEPTKNFSMPLKVIKVIAIMAGILSALFVAKAAFSDLVQENLEKSLAKSIQQSNKLWTMYEQDKKRVQESKIMVEEQDDISCSAWKALKEWKTINKIPTDPTINICTQVKAQHVDEGF